MLHLIRQRGGVFHSTECRYPKLFKLHGYYRCWSSSHILRADATANITFTAENDQEMTGGYKNPPPTKRAMRDPYGAWWHWQERRNYGEPLHEDDDILGLISPERYTQGSPKHAFTGYAVAVLVVLGVCGLAYHIRPENPAAPRTFPGGLIEELGGPGTLHPPADEEDDAS